MGKSMVIGTK